MEFSCIEIFLGLSKGKPPLPLKCKMNDSQRRHQLNTTLNVFNYVTEQTKMKQFPGKILHPALTVHKPIVLTVTHSPPLDALFEPGKTQK